MWCYANTSISSKSITKSLDMFFFLFPALIECACWEFVWILKGFCLFRLGLLRYNGLVCKTPKIYIFRFSFCQNSDPENGACILLHTTIWPIPFTVHFQCHIKSSLEVNGACLAEGLLYILYQHFAFIFARAIHALYSEISI